MVQLRDEGGETVGPVKRRKPIEIPIAIYGTQVVVFFGTAQEFSVFTKRMFNWEASDDVGAGCEITLENPSGCLVTLMRIGPHKDSHVVSSIIAHESVHAAMDILGIRGVEMSYESQEALAYLVDYLVQEIHGGTKRVPVKVLTRTRGIAGWRKASKR